MIGTILRAEREKKGLTIKDVENATSIRGLYLAAIEEGNYQELPAPVYARGFVRNYAEFLGLNADAISNQFRLETGDKPDEDAAAVASLAAEAAPATGNLGGDPFSSGRDFQDRVKSSHRQQNWLVAGLVVTVALVGGVYYFFGDPGATPAKKPTQTATTTVPEPQPVQPATTVIDVANSTASASVKTDGVELAAVFSSRCWIKAVADGKTVFEGTVQAGKRMDWKGKKDIVILVGNARAVEITYNGKSLGALGKEGEVIEQRFTPTKAEVLK